jgi:hypothetical protein
MPTASKEMLSMLKWSFLFGIALFLLGVGYSQEQSNLRLPAVVRTDEQFNSTQPAQASYSSNTDNCGAVHTLISVPAGKRFVIEFVDYNAAPTLDYGLYLTTTVGGKKVPFQLKAIGDGLPPHWTQSLRLYADPGTSITSSYCPQPGTDFGYEIFISGYFAPI